MSRSSDENLFVRPVRGYTSSYLPGPMSILLEDKDRIDTLVDRLIQTDGQVENRCEIVHHTARQPPYANKLDEGDRQARIDVEEGVAEIEIEWSLSCFDSPLTTSYKFSSSRFWEFVSHLDSSPLKQKLLYLL